MTPGAALLEATGLRVRYAGGDVALDDVSFAVAPGLTGLLGPNGAGKSTLLRVLATLQRPDAGTVRIAGVDALADPDAARARIGYLPQEFGFPPALTPLELLAHFALLKGVAGAAERRATVEALLHRVNLWRVRDRAVRALSGGMRQRLGVAVALVGAPPVLLVDEPTVALDPVERHRLHDLVVELATERAVLFSTHLVADVEALCRDVLVLHRGRIVRRGAPDALVATLAGRTWRARVAHAAAPAVRETQRVIRDRLVGGDVELTVVAERAPTPAFVATVPTLDDVFAEAIAT
jgi:ABC-type multidrug transport system ATPase subunit